MAKILVVDDNKNNRITLSMLLRKAGYNVDEAENGRIALFKINQISYDLIITDLKMNDIDGIAVLNHVKDKFSSTEVIVLTAYASVDSAVKAMRMGAYDYIAKGNSKEETLITVEKALEKTKLINEVKSLKKIVQGKHSFENIIGNHPKIQKIFELINSVSNLDVPVLICGESGTGKELIARAIHLNSKRVNFPFVVINCGAMPENLQESELFGHTKGAFTGAFEEKIGLFREAEGGTLFMDEVSEMSLSMQVKLLRVLQDGEVRAVGSNISNYVNTRLIFATNNDLKELTLKKIFREDLLFRINVFRINLPSLRERKSDIPLLADHFLKNAAIKFSKKIDYISSSALSLLTSYDWPGNVRELKNVVERAVILSNSNKILPKNINIDKQDNITNDVKNLQINNNFNLKDIEKKIILTRLEKNNWNKGKTASELGISTTTLWRKINEYNLYS